MMRSLSSAVAGLRTHQTKMDVIGNNIANVNTFGFKASRTTFSDVYYQNLSAGSGPSTGTGGTNPTQIGYGASVATIDILNTQSGSSSTDRALDVYITGDGFLVTQDPSGNFMFTRLGNMGFDAEGNLIDSSGNYVMGFSMSTDADGNKVPNVPADGKADKSGLSNIKVDPALLDKLTGISIGTSGEIVGILEGDAKITIGTAPPNWVSKDSDALYVAPKTNLLGDVKLNIRGQMSAADAAAALGVSVSNVLYGDTQFVPGTDAGTFTYTPGTAPDKGVYTFTTKTVDSSGTEIQVTATATYDDANQKLVFKEGNNTVLTLEGVTAEPGAAVTGAAVNLAAYYKATAKDKGGNTVNFPASGEYEVFSTSNDIFSIGSDIKIKITDLADLKNFSGTVVTIGKESGEKLNVGCLVLAKFRNAAGLEQAGSSKYMETANSGEAVYVRPGLEGTGALKANYLEMSNVDIAKEFTDMITTQRGFQANTRIVTVSDEMLQELVNLKR